MGPLDPSAKFLFLSVVSSFPLILYMAKEGGDYSTALLFVSPSLPMLTTGNPFPAHVQRSFVVQKKLPLRFHNLFGPRAFVRFLSLYCTRERHTLFVSL